MTMTVEYKDKVHVGREEAWEYCIARNFFELPRKGYQVITSEPIASGRQNTVVGKDEEGYYIAYFIAE